jgi:hypothetical protein
MSKNVFISYSVHDQESVYNLTEGLKARGIDVWLASEQINLGDRWSANIEKAIKETDLFLVLVSPTSVQSSYVNYEIETAKGFNKPMVGVALNRELALSFAPLTRQQVVTAPDFSTKSLDSIAAAINGIHSSQPVAE